MVEKGQIKYELVVKDGEIEKEDGYFFQAGPFEIMTKDGVFNVEFKRFESLVVFDFTVDGKSICQLKFPDYSPECGIADIEASYGLTTDVMAALVYLKVSIDKDVVNHFSEMKNGSYSVRQFYFL